MRIFYYTKIRALVQCTIANSSIFVFPIIHHPAASSLSNAVLLYPGIYHWRIFEQQVVSYPLVIKISFIPIGAPANGKFAGVSMFFLHTQDEISQMHCNYLVFGLFLDMKKESFSHQDYHHEHQKYMLSTLKTCYREYKETNEKRIQKKFHALFFIKNFFN